MANPSVLYGPEGEQFNIYASQRWPYGTQMIMQDGRKFRYALAGGTLLVIGDLLQQAATVANDVGRTAIAAALGSKAPTLTTGGAVTANLYAEGYFHVDVDPGKGLYLIDNHLAGTTATVYNILGGIRVAALTTTSRVSLIANPYKGVIQFPITTPTGKAAGVAVSAIAATTGSGWVQTAGTASVLTSGTVIVGNVVIPHIAAGAVGPAAGASIVVADDVVGVVNRVAATTAWSTIRLSGIDG